LTVKHRGESATAFLGMSGFAVRARLEVDGELWSLVETMVDAMDCLRQGRRRPDLVAGRAAPENHGQSNSRGAR
jgi:hypothetical protein